MKLGEPAARAASRVFRWRRDVPEEADVQALAAVFAQVLQPPCAIFLRGDLGAGKTTFVRAFVQALGFAGRVKSPSYGLLETYEAGGLHVLHLDLYRIEDAEELEYLAIRDLYDGGSLLFVEWPDHGGDQLPAADIVLDFGESDEIRFINCTAISPHGQALAKEIFSRN